METMTSWNASEGCKLRSFLVCLENKTSGGDTVRYLEVKIGYASYIE